MKKLGLATIAISAALVALPAQAQVAGGGANVVVRHGGNFMGGMHPGANFRHHRLQRGFMVHPFWFGPQFHVQNWQLYGFAQPQRDQRWVRYYDDAYLIDREGRVADMRYDLDWDEYGEDWDLDDGIPHYEGRNDWRPDDEDYAWVEGNRRGHPGPDFDDGDYADHGFRRRLPNPGCAPGPQPCGGQGGYAYPGYAYPGYGYGVAYPIIIETTVTTGGCDCEEVIEEVVEVRQRPQRRRVRAVQPRPPAGERG
jgi:hypothetical protein